MHAYNIYGVEPVGGSIDPHDQTLPGRGIPACFAHTRRELTAWRIRTASGGGEVCVLDCRDFSSEMQPPLLACLGNLTLSRCQGGSVVASESRCTLVVSVSGRDRRGLLRMLDVEFNVYSVE